MIKCLKTLALKAKSGSKSGLWVVLMVALACMPTAFTGYGTVKSAHAADMRVSHMRVRANEKKRYVKIGLNKSMVIHLPRAARDVLVSGPKIVEAVIRSSNTSYLIGRAVGQTNIFYFDAKGKQILNLEVQVDRDLSILERMYKRLMPNSAVKVEALNNNVVLTGSVANAGQSQKAVDLAARLIGKPDQVLNMLTIAGKEQVLIKVTIVEMQRSVLKQLGVDVSAMFNISNTLVNLASLNPFSIAGTALNGSGGSAAYSKGSTTVSSAVRAMERNGLLRTLAEPTLTAISGESAKFLAGGEFPVPASRDGDGNVVVTFKPFGVGLGFTPVVLSSGRISLKISTEVSELSADGAFTIGTGGSAITIPALKVRRAETTVEMSSGGSLVMAGLIQENTKQSINSVPGIKDVPILGALFRSRDFQNSQTELVVIVTPYLVNQVARKKLIQPDHNFAQPNDLQTTFLGHLNKVYGASGRRPPRGKYRGDIGFIVE